MSFCGCIAPKKINKPGYNKIKFIQESTFSNIWTCEKNGIVYCMKIAKPKWVNHLVNEIEIIKKMSHDGIVKYHDNYVDSDGNLVLIEEFVDGMDLFDYIQLYHPNGIPDEIINILFPQMCEIINYIHSMGYIHCDVKPENFLISDNTIKICDFGLSCKDNHNLSGLSLLRGSVNYVAPEAYNIIGVYHETDIWALGITLYGMVCNKFPFPNKHKFRMDEEASVPNLPETIWYTRIKKMLVVNPKKRKMWSVRP